MALTSVSYLGDGSNRLFSVTFPYLSKSNVKVFINGVEDTTFTWSTSSTIQTTSTPASGSTVVVKRETPTTPLVDFVDGSTITESLLDTSTVQGLHVAEETKEFITGQIALDTTDNTFNAGNKRIKNVANPVNNQDVATKVWTETALNSGVNQAQTAANQASASATSAQTSANTATSQANTATTKAADATTQAGIATTRANEAAASASQASTSASTATIKASEANASANTATSQATIATNNANNASNSASTATTQANIATTKAAEAAASAQTAQDIAGSYVRASQEEAELGEENSHYMTALRTKQAIDTLARGGMSNLFAATTFGFGVWVVPDNVYRIKVTVVGGGGARVGAGTSNGGGGAGGYSIKYADVTPGEEISYEVGLPTANNTTAALVAGTSWASGVNFSIQATGGTNSYSPGAGTGGLGSGGDINGRGGDGFPPNATSGGASGASILSAGGGGTGTPSAAGRLGSGGSNGSTGAVLIEY